MSTESLRVAVIGAGAIARLGHIPGLQKVSGVKVVALCDSSRERAEALAVQTGIPKVYTDFRELIAQEPLDAVTLGIPNALHASMALAALDAGLHVFCEKPLAISLEQGRSMVEAVGRSGKVFALNMQMRARADFTWVREAIRAGKLGEVRYATGRWFRQRGIPGFGSWFTRKELSGGGVLMDIGVHMLDATLWMLGYPEVSSVRGEIQAVHGPRGRGLGGWGVERHETGVFDVEDFAALHLRLKDGGLVTTEVSWAFHGRDEHRVQIVGTESGVDVSSELYGEATPVRVYSEENAGEPSPVIPRSEGSDWDRTVADFIGAIREKRRPLCPVDEGFAALRYLLAGYESARTGAEVAVPD